jgi:hypothetical protein
MSSPFERAGVVSGHNRAPSITSLMDSTPAEAKDTVMDFLARAMAKIL